jgi:hypothetical protein
VMTLDPRDAVPVPPEATPTAGGWVPCGHCWGQGRILTPDPLEPSGYTIGVCPWCVGVRARWTA